MRNSIELHGYLGRDPEIKEYQGKNGPFKKAMFTLGVSRDFGDETDWFLVTMVGKRAETLEKFCRKGSEVIVYGRMESYKPKNDPDRSAYIVIANGFDFCGKPSGARQQDQVAETFESIEEEVPF